MIQWTPYCDEYLYKLIRNEGRGDVDTATCSQCKNLTEEEDPEVLYHCLHCGYPDLLCQKCCLQKHRDRPFDVIEVHCKLPAILHEFTKRKHRSGMESISKRFLKSLGLVISFGHKSGEHCLHPHTIQSFTILHTNGIHDVTAEFCCCSQKSTTGEY
jgi:hypothetical protein